MAGQRLSREERHTQLLDTAAAIVRAKGTDALTMARVAQQGGVTRPLVYGHFETRAGLLKALYRRIEDRHAEAACAALAAKAPTLRETVSIFAEAYVDCVLHIGKEFGSVTAALSASPEMDEILRSGRERYVKIYLKKVEQFAPLPSGQGGTIMLGVIGAADTLAREVTAGRLGRPEAIKAISRIILGAIGRGNALPSDETN